MTEREKLVQQYEDALFALLMDEVAQAEGEEALRLNERLQQDPDAAIPEVTQRRCERTIRNAFAKQTARRVRRSTWKVLQRVAVVAMLGVILLTTAFAAFPQFRVTTLNAMIDVYDAYSELRAPQGYNRPRDGETVVKDDLVYHYNIALEWVPDGYEFSEGGRGAGEHVFFINREGFDFYVLVTPIEPGLVYQFDTEDVQEIDVTVQGYPAKLYVKEIDYTPGVAPYTERSLIWIDEQNQTVMRIVAMDLTQQEILDLAEGIRWAGR